MFKKLLGVRLSAMLNSTMGGSSAKKGSGKGKVILFAALMVYAVAALGFVFKMTFSSMALPMYEQGLGWFYFAFCFLSCFAIMFIFSIFTAKSQLFEAKDNEMLLALPIKPRDILLSRIAVLLIMNVVYELAVALPAAYEWCKVNPVNPLSAVFFVLLVLALPLFATSFSCLFGWFLSLLTARIKNKTPFTVALSVIFLGVYFYFYNALSNSMANVAENAVDFSIYAEKLSSAIPLVMLGKAVSDGNILYFIIWLAVFVLPFAAVVLILSKNFFKTVFRGAAAVKTERTDKVLKVNEVKKALLGREFKRLSSSANYIMNSGIGLIMELIAAVALVVMKEKIDTLLVQFTGYEYLITALVPGILCFFSTMAMFTAPSVSLEGKTLWLLRSCPLNTKDILDAKLKMHLILCMPVTLLMSISAIIVLPFSPEFAIFTIVIPQLYTVLIANFGLVCDLKHPNLNWLSEVQAVKQSISVLLTMAFGFFGVLVPFAPLALFSNSVSPIILLCAVVAVYTLADVLTYRWIKTTGVKLFEKL